MLKLKPDPTFKLPVSIPLPGGKAEMIEVEFKHKTKDEFNAFLYGDEAKDRDDVTTAKSCAVGWNVGPFDDSTIGEFFANYHAAASALVTTYCLELTQVKAKN